jgi:hypothetical protein
MTRTTMSLLGVSALVFCGAAVLVPSGADAATCCQSNWSSTLSGSSGSTTCSWTDVNSNFTTGTLTLFSAFGAQANADITSQNAASPSIRMKWQCVGGSLQTDSQFTNMRSGVDEIQSCSASGFASANCQVQFASTDTGSHCGLTCTPAH